MKLEIKKAASNTIAATKNWIDDQNTPGAGDRWMTKLFEELNSRAKVGVKHAICQNEPLAKRKYSCFTYNDKWVVLIKLQGTLSLFTDFIIGSMLV